MRYIFIAFVFLISCKKKQDLSHSALIPKPVSITNGTDVFTLTGASSIYVNGSEELQKIGEYLSGKLKPATGFDLKTTVGTPSRGNIYLSLSGADAKLGEEGYTLNISDSGVHLIANKAAGIFRGVQTLLQLLPASIEQSSKQNGPWEIAAGTIEDYPSYSFRGSMLDVARHFFSVEDVKHYIDLIAFYKMNVLHLHLSDDQGWRIEIKSWPNLTAHGGSTEVGGGKGGFYTQEQYKDIVNYAASKYITVIPEIDLPGHTNAALASYAELNCNDTATALYTKTEVGFSTFCAKKDITYKFIDDVVRELAAITPGPYIHLGGDESHATAKDDYILFINKIQGIPKKYGKKMIGWEEIAQSNLDSSTVVQFWTDPKYANEAVNKGAKMILSPATKVYLDMKYDSTTKLGLDWAARIEIDSSYIWSLSTAVKGLSPGNILGVEAPLWTETISSFDDIEYMVFPRLPGIAEIGWSPEEGKSWEEYKVRLGKHGPRMKAMNINFYKSRQVPWE
jgi:hexosaminidase